MPVRFRAASRGILKELLFKKAYVYGDLDGCVELQVVHSEVLDRTHTRAGTHHRRAHLCDMGVTYMLHGCDMGVKYMLHGCDMCIDMCVTWV
jgi:hypothetical protein